MYIKPINKWALTDWNSDEKPITTSNSPPNCDN
jgi:hypothetical protein